MAPFQPTREDGRSLRQVAYEYLAHQIERGTLRPGQIIRHQELASEMGVVYPSSSYFQALTGVTRLLQQQFHLSLVSVRGTGYKIVEGMAMIDKSRDEHRRGRRQIGKAVATVGSVDESSLETADQRTMLTRVRHGMQLIAAVIDQQAEHLAQHDEEIEILKSSRMDDRSRIAAAEEQIRLLSEKLSS